MEPAGRLGKRGEYARHVNRPRFPHFEFMSPEADRWAAEPGHLYVVSTPIGNLADLSPRARAVLETCTRIACEDTRRTGALLARLSIRTATTSYHDGNERERAAELLAYLQRGASIAVVSDSGTPGISDPGFRLVRECRRARLPVIPVPGPCAAIAALASSGLPTDRFFFAGFAPPKTTARRNFLTLHTHDEHTMIIYESCHRLQRTLKDIVEVMGPDRTICVAREITKLHEETVSGCSTHLLEHFSRKQARGEFVILIAKEGYRI